MSPFRLATVVSTFAIAASFAACGGSSEGGDGDGSSSGSGGSATGGSSGASGKGGTSSGTSGSAGGSSTGGSSTGGSSTGGSSTGGSSTGGSSTGGSSTGGTGGGGRECETADDCVLFSDCCSCEAVPRGTSVPSCDRVCITDHCSAQMIESVTCSAAGRCVFDLGCNRAQATCRSLPEQCPDGLVNSVTEAGCWGPCVAPTDCSEVTDCADCGTGDVCVKLQPQIQSVHCVRPDPTCTKGNYCDCIDACSAGFECTENDEGVACPCPVC